MHLIPNIREVSQASPLYVLFVGFSWDSLTLGNFKYVLGPRGRGVLLRLVEKSGPEPDLCPDKGTENLQSELSWKLRKVQLLFIAHLSHKDFPLRKSLVTIH